MNTQKNPYLNQATQKNTCQIFLPKKIQEAKISNPKTPSIIPVTWNPEYPSWVSKEERQLHVELRKFIAMRLIGYAFLAIPIWNCFLVHDGLLLIFCKWYFLILHVSEIWRAFQTVEIYYIL